MDRQKFRRRTEQKSNGMESQRHSVCLWVGNNAWDREKEILSTIGACGIFTGPVPVPVTVVLLNWWCAIRDWDFESRIPRINDWCLECQELCSNLWMRGISGPLEDVSCISIWCHRSPHRNHWPPEDEGEWFCGFLNSLFFLARLVVVTHSVVIPFSIYGHNFQYFSIQLSMGHITTTTNCPFVH